jgi:hypothetical protein
MMTEEELRRLVSMSALEHRFWAKVQIVDDDNSCWEWTAARHPDGYGHFQMTPPGEEVNRAVNASRVVLMFQTGAMPVVACHTCDNPPCVRPSHLYDGNWATNGADKAARGRARGKTNQRGESNDSAVLTDAIVIEARQRARAGEGVKAIAQALSVGRATINYAIIGTTWSHLDPIEPAVAISNRKGRGKLTNAQIAEIKALKGKRLGIEVAAEYGISPSAVTYHWRRH